MSQKITKSILSLFVSQIYRDLSFKLKKNVFKEQINIPWMRFREIDLIIDLLSNLKPKNCLEWGAGTGTFFFTNYIPNNSEWLSVEHDNEWASLVKKKNAKPNVHIKYIPPNQEAVEGMYTCGTYDKYNDGTYKDFKKYIEYPKQQSPYDFIMIDGRARSPCLIKAKEMLTDRGIVLLHDSNRKYYHYAFNHYKESILFLDNRINYGGIFIGSKRRENLNNNIDIAKHTKLWNLYNKVGKYITL